MTGRVADITRSMVLKRCFDNVEKQIQHWTGKAKLAA
jgi:hypothetical protein